jgi:non-specific serine/threonine protein kinase/serine/threonine-protein kinase
VLARPDSLLYRARKFVVRRAISLAAASALLIAILAGALSTLAQSKRVERRFNDVRSLAHAVLFDVYDSVSALPASLATRRLVANHAQKYLDSLAQEAADDSGLVRDLAESFQRLGDVRGSPYAPNLGDTSGALESYRKAQALLEREALRHPNDANIEQRLPEIYMRIGRILERQRSVAPAIAILNRSIEVAERLFLRDPREPARRLTLSRAYAYLAETQQLAADQAGSFAGYEKVLATSRKSVDILEAGGQYSDEQWLTNLSSRYFRVGYALWALAEHTGDLSYYRQALEVQVKGEAINRKLAAAHPQQARALADGLLSLALSRWKCYRDLKGTLRDLHEVLDRFQRLADADPHDIEAQRDLANAYETLGMVLGENGQLSKALKADRKALAIFEELGRADPSNGENSDFLAAVRKRIAALEQGSGR